MTFSRLKLQNEIHLTHLILFYIALKIMINYLLIIKKKKKWVKLKNNSLKKLIKLKSFKLNFLSTKYDNFYANSKIIKLTTHFE
jgi:hypothetical protein